MTSSSWVRARRVVATASVLAVVVIAVVLLVLAATSGVPKGWWPHTGRAFATGTRGADRDPCDLIAGPGTAYCERTGSADTPGPGPGDGPEAATTALRLVPAGAAVAVLVVGQRRGRAEQGRR